MIRYNPKGLTTPQIDESRRRHGDNVITPPKDDSAWRLLLEKFRDPIIRILLLAAVLSLIIGFVHKDFTESVGIICAIILATCVGFWFEWDAQRRFRRLNQVNDDIPVKVMRDGSIREIPRRDVVVGDVVYIESGETIPADGELVEAVSLKINESTLTGEPEVDKTVNEADFDPEATYPSNAVLRGTTVADGYGVMVVTAVGDATEAGRVTEQSTVQSEEQTPLDRQLTRLSRLIGRLGILLSALIFCVMLGKAIFAGGLLESDWLTISQHVLQICMVSVAIIVMAVPEGLPMSITLSLAMSMRRMLKTNNLVRKMHACETMGAVTVICTDKTGTLTQNRMHVQELIRYDTLPAREFAEVVALNTTAFLDAEGHIIGNPTEGALLEWMRAGGEDYEPLRRAPNSSSGSRAAPCARWPWRGRKPRRTTASKRSRRAGCTSRRWPPSRTPCARTSRRPSHAAWRRESASRSSRATPRPRRAKSPARSGCGTTPRMANGTTSPARSSPP